MGLDKPQPMPNFKSLASAVAEILKGNPTFRELSKPKATPGFSCGCDFMMGLSTSKLYTKFEVASFSHWINIEKEPHISISL